MSDGAIVNAFLIDSLAALWTAFTGLIGPAIVFALIALAARGLAAFQVARAAAHEVRLNLALFAFDVVVITPAIVLMVSAVSLSIQQHHLASLTPASWAGWPQWLVALIALFAGDFIAYWRHRLEHIDALWPGHALHHSDTAMTWTTGLRFHPINRVTTALIDTSFLALLGLPMWALVLNNIVRHNYGLFIHMDLPWTYGPLGRVFVSPAMHRWHHIRDANGAGVNFATIFSVFDQAFGTYHVPGPCTVPLGVREDMGRGLLAQLIWPARVLWRFIFRRAPRAATS